MAKKICLNIFDYKKRSVLINATFSFIASHLTEKDHRNDLTKIFKLFDVNNDGKLSKKELKEGFLAYIGKNVSDLELDAILRNLDLDKSGFIE